MELWRVICVSINISILNPPQRPCSALQGLDHPSLVEKKDAQIPYILAVEGENPVIVHVAV